MLSPGFRQPSEESWPAVGLDVQLLRQEGWQAQPFRQFVLKLHSRCNLSCNYCYVYEMADQSWRDKPVRISPEMLRLTALRIAEHVTAHDLSEVQIVLHGGEPLLCGAPFIDAAARLLRSVISPAANVSIRLQTNGTLLTADMLAVLLEHDIKVGVSLDGTARSHDARRGYASGQGSYRRVSSALRRLAADPYSSIFAGILCTIDISADPVATYESFLEFSPPRLDFLLPHANWSTPPAEAAAVQYGEWLIAAFDRWYGHNGSGTRVRLFEEIIHLLLGGQSGSEMIGISPVALIVIDTDGSMEQVDTLKSAFAGAPGTGLNVTSNIFDEAMDHPSIVARQIGVAALSDRCLACPVHKVCGGGYYPHRYRAGDGFRNPSVYCEGLRGLIEHIGRRVRADLLGRR